MDVDSSWPLAWVILFNATLMIRGHIKCKWWTFLIQMMLLVFCLWSGTAVRIPGGLGRPLIPPHSLTHNTAMSR